MISENRACFGWSVQMGKSRGLALVGEVYVDIVVGGIAVSIALAVLWYQEHRLYSMNMD